MAKKMFPTWNFSLTQFNLVVLEKFATRCKMAKIWSKLNFRTDKKKAWILKNEWPVKNFIKTKFFKITRFCWFKIWRQSHVQKDSVTANALEK